MSGTFRDFHSLKKELLEKNSLFLDPSFPADSRSLTFGGYQPRGLPFRRIEWKRPYEISRNPKFIAHELTRSDLDQGLLGNCWFVAAASLIVSGPRNQFERVVPPDQTFDDDSYAGVFRFNFWWYGKWKEIIIDDYLPTDGRQLIYCHNFEERDEFWGALLEKAYAKLRGNYEALDGGKLQDALVDMTGGLGEVISISNKGEIPNNLYDLMWKCSQMNSMLGASINLPENSGRPEVERSNGLYMGHAYSITALSVVPFHGSSVQLLRLRNPWGREEWRGPWSDKSPEITNLPMDLKRKLNIVVEEEGEFWMSYKDFIKNFDEIQLCHLQPDAVAQDLSKATGKNNWSVTVYHDAWLRGVTAGGCGNPPYRDLYWKNPQFRLHLKDVDLTDKSDKCTVIVALMEKEKESRSKFAIGFDIYQIRDSRRRPMDGDNLPRSALIHRERSGIYVHYREIVKRFSLPAGYYVVIPSTFNPHEEAEFILRMYTEKEVDSEVMDEDNSPETPVVPTENSVTKLFHKHAGEDGKMDYKELQRFLQESSAKELGESIIFNEESCRSLLTMMDLNRSGFLDLEQAVNVYKQFQLCGEDRTGYISFNEGKQILREVRAYSTVFKQFDKDQSNSVDTLELGTMFSKLGFPVSRMVLTSIVRRYGSRDRKINITDFIIVMCKLIVMYNVFKAQQEKTGGPEDVAQFTRNEFLQYTMFC